VRVPNHAGRKTTFWTTYTRTASASTSTDPVTAASPRHGLAVTVLDTCTHARHAVATLRDAQACAPAKVEPFGSSTRARSRTTCSPPRCRVYLASPS